MAVQLPAALYEYLQDKISSQQFSSVDVLLDEGLFMLHRVRQRAEWLRHELQRAEDDFEAGRSILHDDLEEYFDRIERETLADFEPDDSLVHPTASAEERVEYLNTMIGFALDQLMRHEYVLDDEDRIPFNRELKSIWDRIDAASEVGTEYQILTVEPALEEWIRSASQGDWDSTQQEVVRRILRLIDTRESQLREFRNLLEPRDELPEVDENKMVSASMFARIGDQEEAVLADMRMRWDDRSGRDPRTPWRAHRRRE